MMTPKPIIRDETFKATPDEIFDAFTVPSLVTRWYCQHAEIDLQDGGWWTFNWPPFLAASGRYLTVERPHRLVWTWDETIQDTRVAPEAGETDPSLTLDYTFTTREDGAALLHIEESGHGNEERRNRNVTTMDRMLTQLRKYIEEGKGIDWTKVPPQLPR